LSLLGLGENNFISCFNVKYIKQTELFNTINPNERVSSSYHFSQYIHSSVTILNIKSWSNDCTLVFNQKVRIKLKSQGKLFCIVASLNWIINELRAPRKSIENHHNSYKMTDLFLKHSLSSINGHDVGNIMCSFLFTKKWINQQIRAFEYSKGLSVLQNGLEGGCL
jgi:hypothetical protein